MIGSIFFCAVMAAAFLAISAGASRDGNTTMGAVFAAASSPYVAAIAVIAAMD